MSSFRWIWEYIKPYKVYWFWASLWTVVVGLLNVVTPYIGGMIVDEVINKERGSLLVPLLVIMIVATVLRTVLRYVYQMMFETTGQNVLFKIREDLYTKLQEMDFVFFNTTRVGDIMARMTGDTDAIRHAVSWVYFNILDSAILFISAIIFLGAIQWRLMLSMLIITPFIGILTIMLSSRANAAYYEIRESFSRLNSMVEENIGGNKVVKAFANEDYETKKFNKRNEDYRERNLFSAEILRTYLPVLETLAGLLSVITIGLGGFFVIRGIMTVGELVAFSGLTWMLNVPMRSIGMFMNDSQRFITATYKIRQMLSAKPLIPVEQQRREQRIRGEVEFQHVSFAFADDPENKVLEDISLKASPGQTIGILGETGSGKSTLVNLISRFFDPTEGRVLIDGEDIKNWNVRELRQNISIVMQDVFLFSDTIQENISYGTPEAPIETIREMAKVADASPFIEKMPEKYGTYLGERGSGLSGGQKQRLSLARGLMKNPAILILDDTTSAVDMETEVKIQDAMRKVSQEKTTFIIANRISSVKAADEIVILSKGRIVERGRHSDLLQKRGAYYDIYREQLGQSEVEEAFDDGTE
ncbi:ABC transporter ATP-binding protein/permease [Desemzia sp. C1]|uniref:ABC transporter ATP-binding protein n=1 Tax=Desemzia sp. C1 TaxID=2892016 RepID=UPI001E30E45E|nr:ABC transporter ATP-binding protein [Desemzia sp. C1]MCI3028065.1 ABC transporter ATP-binding protein/permease [Desemzia sp. C1]